MKPNLPGKEKKKGAWPGSKQAFMIAFGCAIVAGCLTSQCSRKPSLQGGRRFFLGIKMGQVFEMETKRTLEMLKRFLAERKIPYDSGQSREQSVWISGIPIQQRHEVEDEFCWKNCPGYTCSFKAAADKVTLEMTLSPAMVKDIQEKVVIQTRETLKRRLKLGDLDGYSISGSVTDQQIVVELPKMSDYEYNDVMKLLTCPASFHLKLVHPNAPYAATREDLIRFFGGTLPEDYEVLVYRDPLAAMKESFVLVSSTPVVSNAHIHEAEAFQPKSSPEHNHPVVRVSLNPEGAARLGEATAANIGRRIAFVVDERVISTPYIQAKVTDSCEIAGLSSLAEAKRLAIALNSGALPAELVVTKEETIKSQ